MPWCPNCKAEYVDEGILQCDDCKVELVEKLPLFDIDKDIGDTDKEVLLISVKDEIEFSIIESKLRPYNIPVIKRHREAGDYLTVFMGTSPLGIDIFVPSKILETAKEIIAV
jgi:hypothetical protein